MIISHKYKFIFIKTVKTAGTSVEVDLNRMLGPRDVATTILPPVEGHTPQNETWRKWGLFRRKYFNHMPARAVRESVGRKTFRDYFVFCVEREPIDKCISHFNMLKNSPLHNNGNEELTIDAYIQRKGFPIDTQKYTDEAGNLIVDRIIRYEALADELRKVGEMLGFEVTLKARAKAGFREEIKLSDTQADTIYEAFKSSNKFTGYSR